MSQEAAKTLQGIKTLMCEIPMFDQIRPDDATVLAQHLEYRKVPPKTVLAREGAPGDSVFFITNGKVDILKESLGGKQQLLATRGKGTTVGELALVQDAPARIATIVATEETEVLSLRREMFDKLVAKNPAIAVRILRNIANILSQRLGQLSGKFADLSR